VLADAGWTKGIAYPFFATTQALVGTGPQVQKEHLLSFRETRSKIERTQRAGGRSTEPCHSFQECRRKAPVERVRAQNVRIAGLKAEHEFLKRDAVCISDTEHPGRKEFVWERSRSKGQLRWRRCSAHRAETHRSRRSTIETKELVTRSSLSRARLMCSWRL
jgi:hypothetical protein